MFYKYFIEILGVVTLLYAKLLTEADPIVMGLVYFSMLTIAKGITTSYFSPMSALTSYSMGHMQFGDLWYNILSHIIGTSLVIISYKPVHTMIVI
jgi:hypothetical protein